MPILIADDEQQLRGWLRHVLEDQGYVVEEVGDGKEVLSYLEQATPALIVLDLFMPNMDGPEVLSYLRLSAQPIKTLAISGQMFNGYNLISTARVLGAHDALAKPFTAQEFLHKVETLLCET